MADPTGWNPTQISSMASAVSTEADTVNGLAGSAPPPHQESFGKLLAPPASNAFPYTTDGIDSFLTGAGAAVGRMGDGLDHSATSYQSAEDQAVAFASQIAGGGGAGAPAPATGSVTITPRTHWVRAKGVLGGGAATGGDGFSGGNIGSVLMPTALDWLNAPVAVYEMVANGLGFLAGTLLSYFPPFDDAIEKLTGDPDAIRQFKSSLENLARALDTHVGSMDASTRMAPEWFGEAADNYQEYAVIQQGCMQAAKALVDVIGPSVEGVAANTAHTRKAVVAILVNVIEEIVRQAVPNLFWLKVALGFAVVPGGIIVSGAMIAGILSRFVAWVVEFLATEMQVIAQLLRDVAQQGNGYLGQIRQLGNTMERAGETLRTGVDPGPGNTVSDGSLADSMMGTEPDPRDGVLIDMMAGQVPDNMQEATPEQLEELGLTPDMLVDDANGFKAHVYVGDDGSIVILFEGTDFGDSQQRDLLQENVPGGTGMGPQSEMAIAIAQAVGQSPQHDNVLYAGHSLGGRLAATASLVSGNPAVTANAAGVSPAQLEYIAQSNGTTVEQLQSQLDSGQVRVYQTDDDILTGLQEDYPITPGLMPDAVGVPIDLPGHLNPVDGHGSGNVRDNYNDVYGTDRPEDLTPVP